MQAYNLLIGLPRTHAHRRLHDVTPFGEKLCHRLPFTEYWQSAVTVAQRFSQTARRLLSRLGVETLSLALW